MEEETMGDKMPEGQKGSGSENSATKSGNDAKDNQFMAILAYIVFFVPLLAVKGSPFVKFHTKQGLGLFLAGLALNVAAFFLSFLSFGLLSLILYPAITLIMLVFVVMGIMNAVNGKMVVLPVFGKLADEKLNINM